ncbi:MAG: hypothetical protein SGBAC_005670 [Bacillariaceae sp.]
MVDEESFDTAAASNRIITTKKGKEARVEYKDFWGSAISAIEDSQGAPCVPTLDPFWGTLPKAAYQCEADEIWDPKPTCRIALDLAPILTKNNDPASPHAIEMVQHYLESGFQTFHGATPQFIEKFHSQTPTNIIGKDSIHWVLHYKVPTKIQSMHSVRHDILDNLLEPMSACTDAIDTLVVQYNPKSPYHMDVMYVLNELQEEGFIRSIGLQNFPPKLVLKASEYGFPVSLIKQPGNLLLPPDAKNLVPPIENQWITNPFVDGLLLDEINDKGGDDSPKRYKKKNEKKQKTSANERIQAGSRKQQRMWDSTLQKWAKLQGIVS